MEEKLKVLFAEDESLDFEVAKKIIQAEGFDIEAVLVENAKDFEEQLKVFKPDLVISDYSMPQFNGMDALRLARDFDPLMPFIILTGSKNEEVAVSCMRNGANDYIIKENMKRLPLAINEIMARNRLERQSNKAMQLLQKSEEKYRMIAENTTDVIFMLDLKLRFQYVSPAIEKLVGYTVAETMRQEIWDVLTPESEKLIKKVFAEEMRLLREGNLPKDHKRVLVFEEKHKNGNIIWVEASLRFVYDEQNQVTGILGISRDVTDKVNATQMLDESSIRLSLAVDSTNQGLFDFDIITGEAIVSDTYATMLGYNPKEFEETYESWIERMHPDDRDRCHKYHEDYLNGLFDEYRIEFRQRTANGNWKWILSLGKIVEWDPQGNPTRMLGTHTDIDVSKRNEEMLFEAKEYLENLINYANAPIIEWDAELRIKRFNKAFEKISGYEEEEMLNREIGILFPENTRQQCIELIHQATEGNRLESTEIIISRKDGKLRSLLWNTANLLDKSGQFVRSTIANGYDITERKKALEELRQSEELFKQIFVNAPIGIINFDEKGVIKNCNEHFIQIIGSSAEKLIGLDMTKLPDQKLVAALHEALRGKVAKYEDTYHSVTSEKVSDVRLLFTPVFDSKGKLVSGIGIVEDVSEQKKAGEALRASEERFSKSFYSSPVAIAITRFSDGTIIDANNAWSRSTGFTREALINAKITDLEIIDKASGKTIIDEITNRGYVHEIEVPIQTRTGEKRFGLFSVESYYMAGAKYLIKTFFDITDRKIFEQELSKLTRAVEQSPVSIVITDLAGNIEYVNPRAAEVSGYLPGELIGQNPRLFSSGELPKLAYQNMYETISSGSVWHGEFHNKKKNGTLYWESATIAPVINDEGVITHYLAVKEDITEWKRLSEEVKTSEKRYRDMFLNNPLPMWIYDVNTLAFVEVNTTAVERYGYSQEEFLSMTLRDIRPESEVEKLTQNIKDHTESFQESEVWKHLTKDGRILDVEITSHAVPSPPGKTLRLVLVNDITERLKAENALKEAKVLAEASDKLKTNFMNNISHEVRTPLNGIMGASSLLSDPDISKDEINELVGIINLSTDRLIQTITDYMDMSLLTSDNMECFIKNFGLKGLLEEFAEKFEPSIHEKGLLLVKEFADEDVNLDTDRELLGKAINHLLSNAIKFTSTGSITMGFKDRRGVLEIFVKDTGVGIAADSQQRVFERFTQEEQGNVRRFEGSGLGLTIVKGIVELLGGNVRLESEKGVGSVFTLSLPLVSEMPAEPEKPKQEMPQEDPTILIAEDEDSNYFVLEILLRQLTVAKVSRAVNGIEAVNYCKANPDTSLVLMDIKMPEMDGLEATQRIREFNSTIPIIAVTAFAMTGDEQKALNAGCNEYVSKPISMKALLQKLENYGFKTKSKSK